MSTYPIADLLRRWSLGELSDQQAIGHLLQHVLALTNQVAALERRLRQPEQGPTTNA
ncbi:MAG TPA: hypothetical protein PKE45_10285 [Caldilineaceae bacterium]|nr:hypothetical protein [Caldilineaceae bacterium]